MITAGCDVGSLTSKAVVMKNGRILNSMIMKSKPKPRESAEEIMARVLSDTDIEMKDIKFCIGTGYGREKMSFANEALSEIACHGKGARWLLPTAMTVIDIGGQDCKVMKLAKDGAVEKFITNDKCASGTGRFLEVMAKVLNIGVDELGGMSSKATAPITLASACTVWAQADVIQSLYHKTPIEDIAAGINNAMASRIAVLVNSVGIERDVCMTGGVAKNIGVCAELEKALSVKIKRIRKSDPQIAGAIGAALYANEKANGGSL